jgi:hypothetical protein
MSDMKTPASERSGLLEMLNGQAEPIHVPEQQDKIPRRRETTECLQTIPVPEQQTEPGDREAPSGLLPETRRALVTLLRHGVIMASNKRLLFETLCRDQVRIQSHLADMYLHMLLDEQAGMAILLQQDGVETDEEEEISTLITRRTLTLFDTLLLLVLRKHYQEREAAGEQRVMIDIERIEIALHPFLPLTNSSRADRRKLNGALTNMKERRILAAVRGEDERFEITPVIRHVVNAAFLEQMLDEYRMLAGQAGSGSSAGEDDHA